MATITGKVVDKKFVSDNVGHFQQVFAKLDGKSIIIEVKSVGDKNRMYAYLYGVLYPQVKQHFGYETIEEVDIDFKQLFLKKIDHASRLTGDESVVLQRKRDVGHNELVDAVNKYQEYLELSHGFVTMEKIT